MREQARRREKDCFGQKGATVLRQTQKRQLASLSSYRGVLTKSTARQGLPTSADCRGGLRANRASYYRSCYRQTPSAVRQQTVWSDRPARASDRAVLATMTAPRAKHSDELQWSSSRTLARYELMVR